MREKYESLSATVLKDLAKARGMKNLSGLKKAELVERMLEQDEIDKQAKEALNKQESEAENSPSGNTSSDTKKKRPEKKSASATKTDKRSDRKQGKKPSAKAGDKAENLTEKKTENKAESADTAVQRKVEQRKVEQPREEQPREEQPREEQQKDEQQKDEQQKEGNTLDSGELANGILEVMQDGYGFIRCDNYMPGDGDVYVSPSQIRRFNLKTGDIISGNTRVKTMQEKFSALLFVASVNGRSVHEAQKRPNFEDLTPIFPNKRIRLETPGASTAMRIVDLVSPIGKGQRGMIVSQPKAGKTTLLKQVATSVIKNEPNMHMIILLIDERPEEVTDMKEAIQGENVEVIYSTFDESPEHHKRVSEMVIERAKRLVEHGEDVMILLDSITRLARAYNLTVQPSGRTLSGGLDPAALHMPKRFFGAARNMREGGSLTILATALVETGSKMDDVVFEEFKGTGNMELVLDRKLSEKRVFPAIDIVKSSTRREDLLLNPEEMQVMDQMRRAFNGKQSDEAVEQVLNMFARTRSNREYIEIMKKRHLV